MDLRKYRICKAAPSECSSPCDLCELVDCIGIDECEEYYGSRTYFKLGTPILDACCGGKMFYFDKNDERVLFQDIRNFQTTLCDGRDFEVKPDIQADFTNMPYPDESFTMVVFDPPHLLRNIGNSKFADIYGSLNPKASPTGYQQIKYGALQNNNWRDMLRNGFSECFRVLKHGGFLIFKWNETDIKTSEILRLTKEKPIYGHISGKRSNTHWISFMKG